jgi:RimJ/RimL family protein N-acetyltransferase
VWSQSKAAEVADRQLRHWREHGFGWRVAEELESGRTVGFIGLNFIEPGTAGLEVSEYEIGWWIDPAAQRRGYAREGAAAVRDEAFGRLGAPSVVARIRPANAASIAVAHAIGLRHDFETTDGGGMQVAVYRGFAAGPGAAL